MLDRFVLVKAIPVQRELRPICLEPPSTGTHKHTPPGPVHQVGADPHLYNLTKASLSDAIA
eukprot:8062954-Karenia_brevis.AAC.1